LNAGLEKQNGGPKCLDVTEGYEKGSWAAYALGASPTSRTQRGVQAVVKAPIEVNLLLQKGKRGRGQKYPEPRLAYHKNLWGHQGEERNLGNSPDKVAKKKELNKRTVRRR